MSPQPICRSVRIPRKLPHALPLLLLTAAIVAPLAAQSPAGAAELAGRVLRASSPFDPVESARVTLFVGDLSSFHEARSDAAGNYLLEGISPGSYLLGCSATDLEYIEVPITVAAGNGTFDFALGPETEPGRWEIIGSTEPEFFDATDIGILLPDGTVFFCHDTVDPINFDPTSGQSLPLEGSESEQGCMNGSLLPDGRVILAGGQDGADPGSFRNAIPWVKAYSPESDAWERLPDLQHQAGRWYPGLARLADGSFLAMGGGTAPNAERTATCERYDLGMQAWSYTGSMLNPCEFPPSALLYTGEVLATWSPPQLYDPETGAWRLTGDFNQPERLWPGHSDHSLRMLADGRAIALGIVGGPDANAVMGEIYDPATESWSLTANPDLLRFQCEVVQLPDGRILVAGGEAQASPPPVEDVLGIVKWCDLYSPASDAWRRVADMNWFREYHAVTLLLPDGRVAMTGGTRIKFQYGPTSSDIEGFVPPYLLRGVRPEITAISDATLRRGDQIALEIAPATALTSVVLLGTGSTTHWVDCGVPRRLVLPMQQQGSAATATLPADENVLPLGFYLLFAMVDDIPSVAKIVQIVDTPTATAQSPAAAPFARLIQNQPNPFNPSTSLRFVLAAPGEVEVSIFDPSGRRVRVLHRGPAPAGERRLDWDGLDDSGAALPAGVYLAKLRLAGEAREDEVPAIKMVLLN